MIATLSVTGHRLDKLGGYLPGVSHRLRIFARRQIAEIDPGAVVVGMALGFDMACGWAAVDLGLPFIAAVPFEGQERKWSVAQQREYRELLAHAESVVVVCSGGYNPTKFQHRNEWMVDNSDAVLSLWNGSPGGTANCVRYAHRKRKPVIASWERWSMFA